MRGEIDITNLTAGELSPRMEARTDYDKFYNGAHALMNFLPMPQGGATRRPGTMDIAAVANQSYAPRLLPFEFSTTQAYIIELGQLTARFYMNDGQIQVASVPVQIATPWAAADIASLSYCQSADTMFLVHPTYAPQTITRSSHTAWTCTALAFRDGPYLDVNTTATTLTPSGTAGAITITASATTGINNNQGFLATDVGRHVRLQLGGTPAWGWCIITGFTDSTHVSATVQAAVTGGASSPLGAAVATAAWRLGKWSGTTGYPYAVMFWQNRLTFGGNLSRPNDIDASVIGDFTNFAPTAADGTVVATNAISWSISDDQVNAVKALVPVGSAAAMQLGIYTSAGETVMQPATTTQALGPTNVQVYRETSYGSNQVRPLRIGKSALFFNRAGRKLHEWTFSWQQNGYVGPDLAVRSEHLTRGGVAEMAYQKTPYGILWMRRNDGRLVSMTYLRDEAVVAWAQHALGGNFYGGPARVESLACIPSPDGTYDELWLATLRTVNGATSRRIEVMRPFFDAQPLDEAWFVDAAVRSGVTTPAANALLVGLVDQSAAGEVPAYGGRALLHTDAAVLTGTRGYVLRMNDGLGVIVQEVDGQNAYFETLAPFSNINVAASGAWSLTAPSTAYSGLAHLEKETVRAFGDGIAFDAMTVSGGAITLPGAGASRVVAGLPFTSVVVTLPFSPSRIVAAGRAKRVDTLFVRFFESVGGEYGTRMKDDWTGDVKNRITPIPSRSAADDTNAPPPLFTGPKRFAPLADYDRDARVVVEQRDPMPMTVLAIGALGDIGEGRPA